jgi:hypothetical protein
VDLAGGGDLGEHWPDSGHYLHEEHVERTIRLVAGWGTA